MVADSLVLIPGILCDEAVWQPQMDGLRGVADILVPPHGMADSLGGMAEAILAAAAPRFALAGHSMGGRVALEIYARAPDRVTRLALLDTGYEPLASGDAGESERQGRLRLLGIARRNGMRAMAEDWTRGMVHPQRLTDASLMEAILAMISRASPEQYDAQIRALLARPDRSGLLREISVPTLVLCGQDDRWSPLARHQHLAAQIAGSQLVDVPDCGHMSTMERPQPVTAALKAWLDRSPTPS
ncbi:MAG: alpha/beta fold hydrolase [Pseudomonadota bacterium]